jgi:4-nitrophenyl phosphatase
MTNYLSGIKNIILDMDGVLWRGETPMPGLKNFFETLKEREIGFALATNNATKTASQYTEKFARFGVEVSAWYIVTSAEASAKHLSGQLESGSEVYVIGESGLHQAIQEQGFQIPKSDGFIGVDARTDAVVIGLTQRVCYEQLASATHLINHGALFIGTNPDPTYPSEFGSMPGAGALLAFVKSATKVNPTVIGKPNTAIFEEALMRLRSSIEDTVMVGDRLSTDIAGAHSAGLRAILLLSGVTQLSDLENSKIQPEWVFEDLQALNSFLINEN